jgi:serine/threonine protein kinase
MVVSKGPNWSVQITDFGITKKTDEGQTVQGTLYRGTAGFMAPEMIIPSLRGPQYAIDVWSIGSMAYYMLTNRIFLREFDDLYKYGTGDKEHLSCIYTGVDVTASAKDFITKLLARSPRARLTVDEALSSEWMASFAKYGQFYIGLKKRVMLTISSSDPTILDHANQPLFTSTASHGTNEDLDFASNTWTEETTSGSTTIKRSSPRRAYLGINYLSQRSFPSKVCLCCYDPACQMFGACGACFQRAEECVYEHRCDLCKRNGAEECDGDFRCNNRRASRIPAAYCGKSCSSCYSKGLPCDGGNPICDQCLENVAKRCAEARSEAGAQG